MRVRVSRDAQADLQAIRSVIEDDNPAAFERLAGAIEASLCLLADFPMLGRTGRVEGTRELAVPNTPFIVVYTLPDAIHLDVERILHGRRRYP
jgi:toxin ParE1/3/4